MIYMFGELSVKCDLICKFTTLEFQFILRSGNSAVASLISRKIAPFVQSMFLVALVRKEEVTKEVN